MTKKKKKGTKNYSETIKSKLKASRPSLPDLKCLDEEAEREKPRTSSVVSLSSVTKPRHDPNGLFDDIADHPGPEAVCPHASKNDCPEADMDDDCAVCNEHVTDCTVSGLVGLQKDRQSIANIDDDVELQAMFYLPAWDSAAPPSSSKPHPGTDESLKVILANVAELLSRSPPSLTKDLGAEVAPALLPPSTQQLPQPFHVSFTLNIDDDDEVMMGDADSASSRADPAKPQEDTEYSQICQTWPRQEPKRVYKAADSPTWDEVFESEDHNNYNVGEDGGETRDGMCRYFTEERAGERDGSREDVGKEASPHLIDGSQMNQSMDLFGDDEAFLQMTFPDTSCAGAFSTSTKTMSNTSQMHNTCVTKQSDRLRELNTANELANAYQFSSTSHTKLRTQNSVSTSKCASHNFTASPCKTLTMQQHDNSHDLFSVNFDLGYFLEDSQDEPSVEAISVPSMLVSPKSLRKADTTVSLPVVTHASTPKTSISRLRRPESKPTPQTQSGLRKRDLPSPITSPGARRMLMPGPASPHAPSSLSTLKRRQIESCTTRAEGRSCVEKQSRQRSVCVSDSPPPHTG